MGDSIGIDKKLGEYLFTHNPPQPEVFARLRDETYATTSLPQMQISWEQATFMQVMARLTGARRYLEIGTFTGYSALAIALALPGDGRVVTCDVSEEYTAIARRYWREAGVQDKIDLRLRAATETLDGLLSEGQADAFDLCFIDADKGNYDAYYERALRLVRVGGLIMVDNTLWYGEVANPVNKDPDTVAIRALNTKIRNDRRVAMALTAIGDGVTLAVRL